MKVPLKPSLFCFAFLIPFALTAKVRVLDYFEYNDFFFLHDTFSRKVHLDTTIVFKLSGMDSTKPTPIIRTFSKKEEIGDRLSSGALVAISAVLPGFGQIYNGAYWKLPIVYGAIGTALYFTIEANTRMVDHDNRYHTLYSEYERNLKIYNEKKADPQLSTSEKSSLVMPSSASALTERSNRDIVRKDRDERILLLVLAYALSLIDVYVDAQFRNFDVGDVRDRGRLNLIYDENPKPFNLSILNFKIRF